MKETATQVLIRTSQRWYKIKDLDSNVRRLLMSLSEAEFELELHKILKLVA